MRNGILFFLCWLLSGFLVGNRFIGGAIIFVGYLLILIDCISVFLTSFHIDYFLLSRFSLDMLPFAPVVLGKCFYIVLFGTFAIILVIIFRCTIYDYYCKKINFKVTNLGKYGFEIVKICIAIGMILLSLFTFNTGKSWCNVLCEHISIKKYETLEINELFASMGAKLSYEKKYFLGKDICASSGRNLVIIYCESFENGYFDLGLLECLSKRVEEGCLHRYTNYNSEFGSEWTIGALYATQTSLPCCFGHEGNNIFRHIQPNHVLSFAKVLGMAGYKNLFLSAAHTDFGGTGSLMGSLGYEVKSIKDFDVKGSKTFWGVHDYDLFKQAKIEYRKLIKQRQPFNLTLLTIDTHFPKGIPDNRLKHYIKEEDELKFSIKSLDYLLDDFCRFIDSFEDNNTQIIIMSDHLLMGNISTVPLLVELNKNKRANILLTNSKAGSIRLDTALAYYNIPDFVLEVTGVKHNAVFLPNIIFDIDESKIKKHGDIFTTMNRKLCE